MKMFQPDKLADLIEKPKTAHAAFTLEHLAEWLENKNPATEYDWKDCKGFCLIAQYAYANGLNGFTEYTKASELFRESSKCSFICSIIAGHQPYTFGAARSRIIDYIANPWGRQEA